MTAEERKAGIQVALAMLRTALTETYSSMAIYEDNLVFFGTDDYLEVGDINKIPHFSIKINDLVH